MNKIETAQDVLKRANDTSKKLGKKYGKLQEELLTPLVNTFLKIIKDKK